MRILGSVILSVVIFVATSFDSNETEHRNEQRRRTHSPDNMTYDGPTPDPLHSENKQTEPNEKRLTRKLVDNYTRMGIEGRPVVNASHPVTVWFGLAIMQMDLNERENTLHTSVWCRIKWQDNYIRWNPDDYGGIRRVRMSSKKIWIPDIMLYNTASTQVMEREVLVVANYDGTMLWIPHRIYRSSCKVDVVQFPFDQQVCHMTFGSWAYHINELNLQFHHDFEHMDLTDLERENTEWEVLHKGESRLVQHYDCCEDPWVTLNFKLQLKRKLVFSTFILTLPCIFLACMTLVVFWLPPERPDRTSLAMNLFASFLLLLLILVEAAPPTASSVPTLGIYYCFNMVLIMLSIFLSAAVINIAKKGESMEHVPRWLHQFAVVWCGRWLCLDMSYEYLRLYKKSAHSRYDHTAPARTARFNRRSRSHTDIKCNGNLFNDGLNGNILYPDTAKRKHSNYRYGHISTESSEVMHTDINQPCSNTNTGTTATSATSLRNAGHCRHNGDNNHSLNRHMACVEHVLYKLERHARDTLHVLRDSDRMRTVERLKMQWQIIAAIFDRIFFILFIFLIALSLWGLFPRPSSSHNQLD